jgi:predicted enzyme related to lactoylglutathione lyase
MLNLNAIVIGTTQPEVMVEFYIKVFGKPADMVDQDNGFWGWQLGGAYLGILNHSEMTGNAKDPGRILINFETPEVKEEFTRIKSLGATVAHTPYEMGQGWVATLIDPDGNYFQLISPMGEAGES